MRIYDLDTPCLLIDLDIVEKNLQSMQQKANLYKVNLRPHIKTHKIVELAKKQLEIGACGITTAKISEAEVMAHHGIDDIFIANQIVTEKKIHKLFKLSQKAKISVGIDSIEGAKRLSDFFCSKQSCMDYLIEINSGLNRSGVSKEKTLELYGAIKDFPSLAFKGIFTHAGHVYGAKKSQVEKISLNESTTMAEVAMLFKENLINTVSIGSTPTIKKWQGCDKVTEIRPGNYIFNDITQVSLGVAEEKDCALTVLSTVISCDISAHRAVIDGGSKTFALDKGVHNNEEIKTYGKIMGKQTEMARLSEEHGVLKIKSKENFKVGDILRIIPNHACPVINLFDTVYGIQDEKVVKEFKVLARGKVH